jgi:hypothetical protein
MSDFTKEELKRIRQQLLEDRQWVDDLVNPDPLIDKLQSMIDNYCEHSQHIYYGDIPVGECTECHMVMIP